MPANARRTTRAARRTMVPSSPWRRGSRTMGPNIALGVLPALPRTRLPDLPLSARLFLRLNKTLNPA